MSQKSPNETTNKVFDPSKEQSLTPSEACRHPLMRRGDRALNRSVLERWWTIGIKAAGGARVVLESYRSGGRRMTTAQAIERFFVLLNGGELASNDGQRFEREHADAEHELEMAGV